MKTIFNSIIIAIAFLYIGCNQKPNNTAVENNEKVVKTEKKIIISPAIVDSIAIKTDFLKDLIPIDTVNSKSKNVYEKYGIEFAGNCYACDLAELSITNKSIKLTNVCDEQLIQNLDITKFGAIGNGFEVQSKKIHFLLNQIDKAPIYELQIISNNIKVENLRISKYYTLKKLLNKFEEHDCGDFQG